MFQGMGVHGSGGYGRSPLVVNLVDVLVDQFVVEKSVAVVEPDVVTEHAHQDVEERRGKVGEDPDVPLWRPRLVQPVAEVAGGDTQSNLIEDDVSTHLPQLAQLQRGIFLRLDLVPADVTLDQVDTDCDHYLARNLGRPVRSMKR